MYKAFSILLCASIIFIGCRKDNSHLTPINNLKTESTLYLKIKDANELASLVKEIPMLSPTQYAKWKESQGGFTSLHDKYVEIVNALDKAKSKEEAETIISRESNFFYLDDDGRVNTKVSWLMSFLLNEDGLFEYNGVINKYVDNELFFAKANTDEAQLLVNPIGGLDKIKVLSLQLPSNGTSAKNTVSRSVYNNVQNYTSILGSELYLASKNIPLGDPTNYTPRPVNLKWGNYYFQTRTETRDRKIFADLIYEISIQVGSDLITGAGFYLDPSQNVYLKLSHSKKSLFGWNSYKTTSTIHNLSWTATYYNASGTLITNSNAITHDFPEQYDSYYYTGLGAGAAFISPSTINPVNGQIISRTPTTLYGNSPIFSSLSLTASNRGGAWINNFTFSGDATTPL